VGPEVKHGPEGWGSLSRGARGAPEALPAFQLAENAIRNTSLLGASVYGHSGEFGPTVTDLRLSGRGPGTRDPRPRRPDLPS
jgi:hypothetical protein